MAESTLKVGDTVIVVSNGRKVTGTIEKISRILVHILEQGRHRAEAYRRDTQRLNGNHAGRYFFRTLDQQADVERRDAAVHDLADLGLTISSRYFSTDQIEAIADLVRSFTDEGSES